jgi:hypothetical protein
VRLAERLAAREADELRIFQEAIAAACKAKTEAEAEAKSMAERSVERKRRRGEMDERLTRFLHQAAAEEAFEAQMWSRAPLSQSQHGLLNPPGIKAARPMLTRMYWRVPCCQREILRRLTR